ncbi:MAG: hypothetical protein GC134_01900 [Proteobacteria bacterium]|nr:hypothetical protein [Pseudomonadota bacterium]
MTTEQLAAAMAYLYPSGGYIIDGLVIHMDENVPSPDAETIASALNTVAGLTYQEQRRQAYPPIGDQLDAIWKGGLARADMQAQIEAVKAAYPKPNEV